MTPSHWIEHRGQQIFYCDLRDLQEDRDALIERLAHDRAHLAAQPAASVLVLVDLRGTVTSPAAVELLREHAAPVRDRLRRRAVVLPIHHIAMAESLARHWPDDVQICDSIDQAKEWLTGPTPVPEPPAPGR